MKKIENEKYYPKINIFITKKYKFRAKIIEHNKAIPYEVTIGSESWKNGKGRKHDILIKNKMIRILDKLGIELIKIKQCFN